MTFYQKNDLLKLKRWVFATQTTFERFGDSLLPDKKSAEADFAGFGHPTGWMGRRRALTKRWNGTSAIGQFFPPPRFRPKPVDKAGQKTKVAP
jgi:hypothetical protein